MKPIKINEKNNAAIADALKAANGKAKGHTYTTHQEIEGLVYLAEKALNATGLPKNKWAGAQFVSTSGDPVALSYRYARTGTAATIQRTTTGWNLVGLTTTAVYQQGGKAALLLTIAQRDEAVRRFASTLNLIPKAA